MVFGGPRADLHRRIDDESVAIDKLKEGSDVKASYEEKDGKNMATSVEVKE